MDTGARKWGRPYLNRLFFSLLGERMADRVLLLMARRGGRWIAGALNLIGGDCLYGRNWGCVEDVPFLHFELCYYQAIEWAIDHGLARVEAGAQGQHKIARGYLPTAVYSAHYIADPMLANAVARFLEEERREVQGEMDWLAEEYSPFKAAVSAHYESLTGARSAALLLSLLNRIREISCDERDDLRRRRPAGARPRPALAQAAPHAAEVLDANHAAMGAGLDGAGALDVRYGYAGQGMTGEVRSAFDLQRRRLRRQPGHRSDHRRRRLRRQDRLDAGPLRRDHAAGRRRHAPARRRRGLSGRQSLVAGRPRRRDDRGAARRRRSARRATTC